MNVGVDGLNRSTFGRLRFASRRCKRDRSQGCGRPDRCRDKDASLEADMPDLSQLLCCIHYESAFGMSIMAEVRSATWSHELLTGTELRCNAGDEIEACRLRVILTVLR